MHTIIRRRKTIVTWQWSKEYNTLRVPRTHRETASCIFNKLWLLRAKARASDDKLDSLEGWICEQRPKIVKHC